MELKASIVPVLVRIAFDVSVSVYHVSREVHFLLVINIVEGLPVVVANELLSQDALDVSTNKSSIPRAVEHAEH